MSKVKNISGGPLDVPLLDRVIEADEIVEVPDVQADGVSPVVWPPDKWEPVADKAPAKSAGKADMAAAAERPSTAFHCCRSCHGMAPSATGHLRRKHYVNNNSCPAT